MFLLNLCNNYSYQTWFCHSLTLSRSLGEVETSGFALGFQHFPRDLSNVNEWKIMFDPSIITPPLFLVVSIITHVTTFPSSKGISKMLAENPKFQNIFIFIHTFYLMSTDDNLPNFSLTLPETFLTLSHLNLHMKNHPISENQCKNL